MPIATDHAAPFAWPGASGDGEEGVLAAAAPRSALSKNGLPGSQATSGDSDELAAPAPGRRLWW